VSKYIPKVGEAFEWRSDGSDIWHKAGECIVHSEKSVGYESQNGWINAIYKGCDFRPIPTKSDDEGETLRVILNKSISKKEMINRIQQAGFTIPKRVKRSDIHSFLINWTDNPEPLTKELCDLLGDLVSKTTKAVKSE
jgi:hypothetical protein